MFSRRLHRIETLFSSLTCYDYFLFSHKNGRGTMKKISIIIFDDFTDIDLFLMWDLFGRNKTDWEVSILGTKESHRSSNGLAIQTHGNIVESKDADVVLFSSGKGSRVVIQDPNFLNQFFLDPKKQIIGSICSGALILASLGLLKDLTATTHSRAKIELKNMGIKVIDEPLICHGNIATAGGCLSAVYLVGWVIDILQGEEKRNQLLKDITPVGQSEIYKKLISSSIQQAIRTN